MTTGRVPYSVHRELSEAIQRTGVTPALAIAAQRLQELFSYSAQQVEVLTEPIYRQLI